MILLIAYGNRSYKDYAENLARSIKHFSDVKIQLVCDDIVHNNIDTKIFDVIKVKERDFFNDPCKVKLSLFELTTFEKTLYLDVDAICLKDIKPLIEALNGQSIYVQSLSKGSVNEAVNYTPWAKNDTWINHYNLHDCKQNIIHGFQSSIVYFEMSSKQYWQSINELYDNRLNESQYEVMWGQSKQHPDELYHTINYFKLGLQNLDLQPIIYPDKYYSNNEIFKHYFLSMWGNINVASYAFSIYDFVCDAMGIKTQKAFDLYKKKYTSYNGKVYQN